MKHWLWTISTAAILASGAAFAADLPRYAPPPPPPPPFSWTGILIGVNGGGSSGNTGGSYQGGPDPSISTSGGLVGGTLGYLMQFDNNWVGGVVADWDWADITGSTTCPSPAYSCESKLADLGTLRGQLGYAWDRFMVYGTGGLAWGDVTVQTVRLDGTPELPSHTPVNGTTATRVGWTAGLGLEYAVWQELSLKVEWLYYDLGTASYGVDYATPTVQNFINAHENGNLIRVGLDWRFDLAQPRPVVVASY